MNSRFETRLIKIIAFEIVFKKSLFSNFIYKVDFLNAIKINGF